MEKVHFLPDHFLWFLKLVYAYFFFSTNKYSDLVIGNISNVVGFVMALKFQKSQKKITLIDDGLATVNRYIERNKIESLKPQSLFGGRMMFFLNRILMNKDLKSLTFFTTYQLNKLAPPKYDQVVNQECSNYNGVLKQNNELWFIGSPLLEEKRINKTYFYDSINKVQEYATSKGLKLKYILHRREYEKDNINCERFDLPIEVVLGNTDLKPAAIVSYYSSALIHIASLYSAIDCYYINLHKKDKLRHENLKTIYDIFKHHNNLDELNT